MEQEIKNKSIDEIREDDHGKWVHDASLDHKGQVPLRASTGVWKASFFIIGKGLNSMKSSRKMVHQNFLLLLLSCFS